MKKQISPRFLKTYCKMHLIEVEDVTECSRHRNNLLRRNAIMYWYYEHYKNDIPKSALYSEIGSIFKMSRVNCFEQIRNFDFFLLCCCTARQFFFISHCAPSFSLVFWHTYKKKKIGATDCC